MQRALVLLATVTPLAAACSSDGKLEFLGAPTPAKPPGPERIVGLHAIDKDRAVFAIDEGGSPRRGAIALVAADGTERWRTPLPGAVVVDFSDNGPKGPVDDDRDTGAERGLAIVGDDVVVVHGDPVGIAVTALVLATGKLRWTTPIALDGENTSSIVKSPRVIDAGGDVLVVSVADAKVNGDAVAIDRATGARRWRSPVGLNNPRVAMTPDHLVLMGGPSIAYMRRSDGVEVRRISSESLKNSTKCDTTRGFLQVEVTGSTTALVLRAAEQRADRILWQGKRPFALASRDGCIWRGEDLFVLARETSDLAVYRIGRTGKLDRIVTLLDKLDNKYPGFIPDGDRAEAGSTVFVETQDGYVLVDLDRRLILRTIETLRLLDWTASPLLVLPQGQFATYGSVDPATGLLRAAVRASTTISDRAEADHVAGGRLWIRGAAQKTPAPWALLDLATLKPVANHGVELRPVTNTGWNAMPP